MNRIIDEDERLMKQVLRLAEKGRGNVSPNPLVGAVITRRGKIVGRGYHQKAGMLHAEVNAIHQAGDQAKGGTLYLNLEPCCHSEKRTPPCTDAILKSGIKKVVVAMKDPNPKVNGKGIFLLRRHGLLIQEGVLTDAARVLNEIFTKFITTRLPFVALKIAATLDGKIATATGQSRWITGEKARRFGHRLRNQYDAVLVGKGTVASDDPELIVRLARGFRRNPVRIVVDESLSVSPNAKVFNLQGEDRVILATTHRADETKIKEFEKRGVQVLQIEGEGTEVDLMALMKVLGQMELTSVLIEGGSRINASALHEKVADKIYYLMAPKFMGGENAVSAIGGRSPADLSECPVLKKIKMKKIENDILIEGYLN
ncbi:MAG: bifunctional diaminohydroxyphosphoribosylaminopyrimidine deaminase/5-amino-6-(5-phosphoribosylamino)uracil reductase RibD [Nitrospiria bacterium]